jgi:hypothetical protein
MMQMSQMVEVLSHKEPRRPTPHALDSFFNQRYIKPENIARFLELSAVTIRNWLAGRSIPRPMQEQKLQELKAALERWEIKHGKLFDARLYE